jgi:hypothetical protein
MQGGGGEGLTQDTEWLMLATLPWTPVTQRLPTPAALPAKAEPLPVPFSGPLPQPFTLPAARQCNVLSEQPQSR